MSGIGGRITDRNVTEYLTANKKKYEDLLNEIADLANKIMARPEIQGRVYRFYTRSDKQSGNIFKDVWKIVEKVNMGREKNPNFGISQLGDIIGATIVVVYPSDRELVRKFIDDEISLDRLFSHIDTKDNDNNLLFFGEEKKNGGYYAHHYQLEVGNRSSLPHLRNARCELQIKTVLHDAWGAKTHDLTYKRAGALDARVSKQVEVLGDVLAGIDQQSELLKHIIEGRWALDDRKAKHAKLSLVKRTLIHDNPVKQSEYMQLRKEIITGAAWLTNCPAHDQRLHTLITKLDHFTEGGRYDHSICQLFCLLAQSVGTPGLASLAIDRANSWLFEAASALERMHALRFLSLAHFSFGNKVDAVKRCQEAVEEFERSRPQLETLPEGEGDRCEIEMRNSLAYYLADLADSDAGQKMGAKELAVTQLETTKKVAGRLRDATPEKCLSPVMEAMLMDTEGAVRIACAPDAPGVREGMRFCKEALDLLKRQPGSEEQEFEAFYELHEMRAFQKILDLEQGDLGLSRVT
jgi:ppGpp synthetase/RelA/SpoT-type nucleotidyltranferase